MKTNNKVKNDKDYSFIVDIKIPAGLLGYNKINNYSLKNIKNIDNLINFHILESKNENIKFILKQIKKEDNLIDIPDINIAINYLNFDSSLTKIFSIATVFNNSDNEIDFYLNLKAPIFIDFSKNVAEQYVLKDKNYSLKYKLNP